MTMYIAVCVFVYVCELLMLLIFIKAGKRSCLFSVFVLTALLCQGAESERERSAAGALGGENVCGGVITASANIY